MNTIRGIKLRWLHHTLGDATYQLARLQLYPARALSLASGNQRFSVRQGAAHLRRSRRR